METIKVNMTPCEDIKTIHASQNDNEAREWGFELHNNGDKIDSSSITDQLVFKAYEGGTEEILPTNGSTPTTSPFKGDIKYPQGLLSDQEFTYRQSPTEEDGLAKITDIKGNTLVWNQLYQNTNIPTSQTKNGVTLTNNNDGSWTLNGTATANTYFYGYNGDIKPIVGHKYLMKDCVPNGANSFYCIFDGVRIDVPRNNIIVTATSTTTGNGTALQILSGVTVNVTFRPQIFDLTSMGLDSLTVEDFTSLFPLSYYSYNQGTLLSFNGNGIKTTGFNQWDEEWESGAYNQNTGEKISASNIWRCKNYISVIPNETYYFKVPITVRIFWYDGNHNFLSTDTVLNGTKTVPSGAMFLTFHVGQAFYSNNVCINISSSRNGEYDSYTTSTLSLPISTYFPNGMDGVGTDYDELTNTKATTRMTRVDLGSLNWTYDSSVPRFYSTAISSVVAKPLNDSTMANILCPKYATSAVSASSGGIYASGTDKLIAVGSTGTLNVKDSSYTDATTFKSAMSGVYLVYPLATPTETSFTTASLVTENAEIPLFNNDGVLIGKCTEQLSNESGFFDAKIKLSDADGECYSNKLQLHVERSPQ